MSVCLFILLFTHTLCVHRIVYAVSLMTCTFLMMTTCRLDIFLSVTAAKNNPYYSQTTVMCFLCDVSSCCFMSLKS